MFFFLEYGLLGRGRVVGNLKRGGERKTNCLYERHLEKRFLHVMGMDWFSNSVWDSLFICGLFQDQQSLCEGHDLNSKRS